MSPSGLGCVKTLRGITAPRILRLLVALRATERKNSSSARHYDQIRFRFRTAKTHSGPSPIAVFCGSLPACHGEVGPRIGGENNIWCVSVGLTPPKQMTPQSLKRWELVSAIRPETGYVPVVTMQLITDG